MSTPYYSRQEESNHYRRKLTVYTIVSFGFHIAVFVLLSVSGSLFPRDSGAVPFGSPTITVRAVDPSELARNLKEALPAAEPAAPEPATAAEPEPTPPPPVEDTGAKVVVPDEKAKQEEARKEAEKKKAEEEAKKTLAELKKKDAEEKAKQLKEKKDQARARSEFEKVRLAQRDKFREDMLKEGITGGEGEKKLGYGSPYGKGAPGGDVDACALEMSLYFGRARDRFWNSWVYPQRPEDLTVKLYVEITRDGVIQDARIHSSSGNSLFDKAALDTLTKINPLQPLPKCVPDDTLKRIWVITPEDVG